MSESGTSFLVECDSDSKILYTFWYQPPFLISPYQKMLGDLFSEAQRERVLRTVREAFTQKEMYVCSEAFMMISPETEISMCMQAMQGKVLVLGFDQAALPHGCASGTVKDILHRFMKVVCASDTELLTKSEVTIRDQFELIQKLNNDLVNTQRQVKKANQELNHLNEELNNRLVKDPLTGLVSRYQYGEEIIRAISTAPSKLGIFVFIDLDEFKKINDTLGHQAGDQFLKSFAHRLRQLPIENLICMRIAGDEFGLYIHGYDSVGPEETGAIWQAIKEKVLKEMIDTGVGKREAKCSAGMAVYGRDTNHVYELIDYADFAMYAAKKAGKNMFSVFDKESYMKSRMSPKEVSR